MSVCWRTDYSVEQTIHSFIVKQNEIPNGQSSDPEELAVAIDNSNPARKVFFSEIFLHE